MTGAEEFRRIASTVAMYLCCLFAAIVLYVLSIGPAIWLRNAGLLPEAWLYGCYSPIQTAYDRSKLCRHCLDLYVSAFD